MKPIRLGPFEIDHPFIIAPTVVVGGPPVRPPERQGFGTKVITSSIEGQLHGRAQFDWAADGLTCRLTIPGMTLSVLGFQTIIWSFFVSILALKRR